MFSGFKSRQMRTVPDFLGATTVPAHHGLFNNLGSGTCREVKRAYGFASCLS